MKSLIYKIASIFGVIFAIFHIGKSSGKKQIKNKINQQILDDVKEINKRQNKRKMMIFLLLISGCRSLSGDSFCLWANPITITEKEFLTISDETKRQIDNFNQEYKTICE